MSARPVSHRERSGHARESRNSRAQPLDERSARRNDGDIETFVHVALALRNVVTVRIDANRPIPVDASAKKVGEVFVGDRERTEGEALRWRQPDSAEPFIQ